MTLFIGIKASGVAKLFSREALETGGRIIATDLISNGTAYAVGKMGEELGLPLPITLMLSVGAGVTVSLTAGKYVFKDSAGNVVLEAGADEVDGIRTQIKQGVKYSPANPGPLNEEVANSFNGATYTERVLTEDTVMYRVSGGNAKEVGSYMSTTPQGGGLQSQLDLALNPAWGNTAENVTRVVVPQGTTIYEGIAAPQNIYDSLGNVIGTLPGGGNQVYIPIVEMGWFQ